MGTILGKKLQVRGESRETKWTRLDSGRIDKRLVAELGFGNDRVFSNSFHKERSPDLIPQVKENYIISSGLRTTHGSPYRYDSHVPILSVVPGVGAMRVKERVPTIDIAPTLADLIGIEIPLHVQGKSLIEFFESRNASTLEDSVGIIPKGSKTSQ